MCINGLKLCDIYVSFHVTTFFHTYYSSGFSLAVVFSFSQLETFILFRKEKSITVRNLETGADVGMYQESCCLLIFILIRKHQFLFFFPGDFLRITIAFLYHSPGFAICWAHLYWLNSINYQLTFRVQFIKCHFSFLSVS